MQSQMKIGEYSFIRDVDLGNYPVFSLELNRRVKHKEATNIVVVGEAGSGKSYTAIQLAQTIDKRFSINQVVFTYSDYIREIQRGKHGLPIIFDEPSYAMGKREWYQQLNKALVKTIESQRFLVRPLIIPIINLNLLDKTIRNYLIQFQVYITMRGKARVYRMQPSQSTDKVYRHLFCTIQYPLLDYPCPQKKTSCLDCSDLPTCSLMRAQYERKKEETQLSRYDEGLELAQRLESSDITLDQMIEWIHDLDTEGKLARTTHGELDVEALRYYLEVTHGVRVSRSKAITLRTRHDIQYPRPDDSK